MTDPGPFPCSEETEIAVLGAMLMDGDARSEALERLDTDDFCWEANRRIFAALMRLKGRGQEGDVVTIADELNTAGELEAGGGMVYLAQLVDAVPFTANLAAHADRLQELRALRETRAFCESLLTVSTETGPGEAAGMLERARERLREIQSLVTTASAAKLWTARQILDDPDALIRPVIVAVRLAWAELTTLLAGREKSGKSTLLRWAAARVSTGLRVWEDAPAPEGAGRVLWYGQERPEDVAADFQRMGADLDRVWVRDMRSISRDRLAALRWDAEAARPTLIVIDTLSTLVELLDLDPGSSTDWEPVMSRLGALASESGAAVVVIHHARKSDGEYRDSTAIGAGVDVILEMRSEASEGEGVRKVTAKPRSAVPAQDFSYVLTGTDRRPRLELLDGSLSLEERIRRLVAEEDECSQRQVIKGVVGRTKDVQETLEKMSEDGGPLDCDKSGSSFKYSIARSPDGNGTETGRKHLGNARTGTGGRSVSRGGLSPIRGSPSETQAEPVEEEASSRPCPACSMRLAWQGELGELTQIGLSTETCEACSQHADKVGELWAVA